jgi:hypothetical protein
VWVDGDLAGILIPICVFHSYRQTCLHRLDYDAMGALEELNEAAFDRMKVRACARARVRARARARANRTLHMVKV